jgi:hypothetical protein
MPARLSPGRSGVENPMIPVNRTTGTTGRWRKGGGNSERKAAKTERLLPGALAPVDGSVMKGQIGWVGLRLK